MLIVAGQQPRAETVPGLHMCRGKNELTAEVTGKNSTHGCIWCTALCMLVFVCVRIYFVYQNALYCLLTLCTTCVCVCVSLSVCACQQNTNYCKKDSHYGGDYRVSSMVAP